MRRRSFQTVLEQICTKQTVICCLQYNIRKRERKDEITYKLQAIALGEACLRLPNQTARLPGKTANRPLSSRTVPSLHVFTPDCFLLIDLDVDRFVNIHIKHNLNKQLLGVLFRYL